MKVLLINKNQDGLYHELPWNEKELTQDLGLNILFNAMAADDEFLFNVVRRTVLTCLDNDLDTILYRQGILRDCLNYPLIVRSIYSLSVQAIENRKNSWYDIFTKRPSSILWGSVGQMELFVDSLKTLRNVADQHADKFESEGFRRFFEMLKKELNDGFFEEAQNHLNQLKFDGGVLISAELGKGDKGIRYVLRKLTDKKLSWWQRLFTKPTDFTFQIHPRDDGGIRALGELKDEAVNQVANVLAQSASHILDFFNLLRSEMAFYVGCLNLHEQLEQIGEPSSFPVPIDAGERKHSFNELYDVCLALSLKRKIVGNDAMADDKNLVIITGANQGGKSTFLRSIGVAQLMMQSGMFVPAESYNANICASLFTHFKREEDITMKKGKLDEELSRMNDITEHLKPNSMLLFNESFAATNEREGSEIASQIVNALVEKRMKIFFVTHLFEFVHNFYDRKMQDAIFLRAERNPDATRTFKLIQAEPLQTSFGVDLYNKIFDRE